MVTVSSDQLVISAAVLVGWLIGVFAEIPERRSR